MVIVSTSKSDAVLKRVFGKGMVSIIAIERMLDQFSLDPTVTNPVRGAYIVTNEDVSAARLKAKFEQSAAAKHPAVKIIFINKSSKPIYPNGLPGVDVILQKPKPEDVKHAIDVILADNPAQDAINQGYNEQTSIPDYRADLTMPTQPTPPVQPGMGFDESMLDEPPVEEQPPEILPIPEPKPEPETAPALVGTGNSSLIDRIQTAGTVSDVSVIAREIKAAELIKDLVESNSTYAGIEEKLKALNDTIFTILSDTRIHSLDEKLSKIHALLHDKAFWSAKGDTIIEQRLEEVIDMICTRTSELLNSRLQEIDTAIRNVSTHKDFETNYARLSGLNEERANLLIELRNLEANINDIFRAADQLTIGVSTMIAEASDNITGNDMINMHLKARGATVVSDETRTAIHAALELSADKVPTTFKQMKLDILSMVRVLSQMFDLDSEIIAAQQQMINFLKSKNVEDSVVAETLLKKSLRVYVGEEGVGRSMLCYLISRYKSRQNANVLCLDLTGSSKYHNYGIQYRTLDSYMAEMNQEEFLLVAGSVENSIASAQRIVSTLLRAADYYRVINVVMTTEQKELFSTIAQDVLSVNFIVDTNVERINRMCDIIKECTIENVGQRVIVNKCDVPVRSIITRLGLDDRIDYQICVVPTIPVITDASLTGFNPYGVSSVDLIMEDVVKHA